MNLRPDWDEQFAETEGEKRERWRRIRAKRTKFGFCWQCAKPIPDCRCPNVQHHKSTITEAPSDYAGV